MGEGLLIAILGPLALTISGLAGTCWRLIKANYDLRLKLAMAERDADALARRAERVASATSPGRPVDGSRPGPASTSRRRPLARRGRSRDRATGTTPRPTAPETPLQRRIRAIRETRT